MTDDMDTLQDSTSVPMPGEPARARKAYTSPQLQDWGSLLELTAGDGSGFTDAEGGGSGPF
jgi:hypothetical protein